MKALVIGGRGFVGAKLVDRLYATGHDVEMTVRNAPHRGSYYVCDLADPLSICRLPSMRDYDVVFLVAAINTFQACEGNPVAWHVNVDAPITIAQMAVAAGSFPVFVSSDSVEWIDSAYSRQKAHAETAIRLLGGAIVRPTRIVERRVGEFCDFLIAVGEKREKGVFRWR